MSSSGRTGTHHLVDARARLRTARGESLIYQTSAAIRTGAIPREIGSMHDVATESRPAVTPSHPLDPLTPDEIRKAAKIVRAAHDLGRGMMFETITLCEPDKALVRDFSRGAALPREAFVC